MKMNIDINFGIIEIQVLNIDISFGIQVMNIDINLGISKKILMNCFNFKSTFRSRKTFLHRQNTLEFRNQI